MQSVDDLIHYGRWKRESLVSARRRHERSFDGASLNQSYSSATSTLTDDEARSGQNKRFLFSS